MKNVEQPRRLLVTGAASGIGAATALGALERGWEVIGVDLHQVAEPKGEAAPFEILTCDVTEENSVRELYEVVAQRWPQGPSALVHSAGVYRVAPSAETSASLWDGVMGINARGSFLMAQGALTAMMRGEGDRAVVLLSSIGALRGDDREPSAAYSASKGAVLSLTRQLAAEYGRAGIRVNAVTPGVIDTAMTTLLESANAADFLANRVPLRRAGEAEEVAQVCLFLASPLASYVTGASILVDGGQAVL